ncbi:polysaccharide pyruvyl transferase family protein [Novosphingobium resinovorum]|uniref:polysaccharide pyruvyl transferase family protein n=1 Tax=Novosphingobium TaxID=165696 RepID=UPI001B3C5235|nr:MULTISPECIES: polysaccharide pyruvyl transferase family protein [Novosphingobium]MBF7014535.1 polysaccharide pyruvyl transferase family protein [Novosphingobium sp. HR1a]WJM24985.1 polysaccharide pyruvyl transferase family protein [Novosphingobium resinovorum]
MEAAERLMLDDPRDAQHLSNPPDTPDQPEETIDHSADETPAAARVAILNVKYSPNLGDGIIAECLEGELRRARPRMEPVSIDLAGRTRFSAAHGRRRTTALSIIERLPAGLRALLVPALLLVLVRYRLAPRWKTALAACDGVIIGGGALFQDVDQNFPVKIAEALKLTNARRLPVAIASVGVSAEWSTAGRTRLAEQLRAARLLHISVRDDLSAETWRATMGTQGIGPATIAPDPGLLSARHYGTPRISGPPRVGLCVTAPIALRLHHEGAHDDGQLEAWMRAVARQLTALRRDVVLFTNGSPEDRLFRDRLKARIGREPGIDFAPDFAEPRELAHALSGFDCVLAHRLHACIVAYSYRVPTIGFAWDSKLRSFFELTGRGAFVIDPREASPMHVADLAVTAIEQGVDEKVHTDLLQGATDAIHALAGQLAVAG